MRFASSCYQGHSFITHVFPIPFLNPLKSKVEFFINLLLLFNDELRDVGVIHNDSGVIQISVVLFSYSNTLLINPPLSYNTDISLNYKEQKRELVLPFYP